MLFVVLCNTGLIHWLKIVVTMSMYLVTMAV